ncbi:MAG: hypothetical protein ACO3XJ_04470 [Candidatus Nanopelagicales bacterium]
MTTSKFKIVITTIALALLLSACDSDNRAMTYKARVDRDYKVSGSISFISTKENTAYRNAITPIDRPIGVQNITYTFNAGTCSLDNFTVTLASSPTTPSYYPTSVVLTSVKFANLGGHVGFVMSTANKNWVGTTFNLGSVSMNSIPIPCVDPGAFTVGATTFARSVISDIYGAGRWTDIGKALFVSNIHPDDLGYLWAIYGSRDNFQNTEEPIEIKDNLYNLFGNPVFNDYTGAPQPKGEFAKDLSSIDGIKAYKDSDDRHVVEFTFDDVDPNLITGVDWKDNTILFPSVTLHSNRVCFFHRYGRFLTQENVDITNDPISLTLSSAEISTEIRHQYGVDGIIVYGLGTVNAKNHTMFYSLEGWGQLLRYTGDKIVNAPGNEVCVVPGDIYKYAATSKSLTDSHKTKIKKNLSRYKAGANVTLTYLIDNSLLVSLSNSEFSDYQKLLRKRARVMKKYLVSLGLKKDDIKVEPYASDTWNPGANVGSFNRIVISVWD